MQEYYFLFGTGLVWLFFAVVQDVRTREISNWLNFSLLSIALLYRGLFALNSGNASFFWLGVAGTFFFMALAYILYYGRAFAGGDAKLLMALGPFIPFEHLSDFVMLGLGFVFVLFLGGSIYSLLYTAALIPRKWSAFKRSFIHELRLRRSMVRICFLLGITAGLAFWFFDIFAGFLFFCAFALLPFLYNYGRALESCLFIKRVLPSRLTEGDWLVQSVRAGSRTVHASVHGLSLDDLILLRRSKKPVLIKEGIPFSPAFLLAFLLMVFYVLG